MIRDRSCTRIDRKSTRLNSSHVRISYAVFCLKKKIESFIYQRGRANCKFCGLTQGSWVHVFSHRTSFPRWRADGEHDSELTHHRTSALRRRRSAMLGGYAREPYQRETRSGVVR